MQLSHISESELARLTSIGQPVINRLTKSITKNPNIDTLRPLAKFFSRSVGQLIGDEPLFLSGDARSTEDLVLVPSWMEVPVISWETAAKWQNVRPKLQVEKFIRLDAQLSGYTYALEIEDTTMEPTFMKGTCIIVEPELEPIDRDYVVVLFKGQTKSVFRQILFSGDETFLKSLNPDFDTLQSTKNCKVLGVAVQGHINFKKNAR